MISEHGHRMTEIQENLTGNDFVCFIACITDIKSVSKSSVCAAKSFIVTVLPESYKCVKYIRPSSFLFPFDVILSRRRCQALYRVFFYFCISYFRNIRFCTIRLCIGNETFFFVCCLFEYRHMTQ